jgi:transketolase
VDGYTHHSLEDIALMRVLPNMNIVVPADSVEAKKVIGYCCNDKLPYYIRLNRPKTPVLYENGCEFKLGKWDILFEGDDLSIIATGTMVPVAIEVYEKLKAQNLSVEVINASSIKPFDKDVLLKTAKKNGKIVTLEDHSVIGGLGSLVSEYLSSESPVKVHSFGVNDEFSQSGSIDELYAYYGLTSDEIVKKIDHFY